MVNTKLRDNPRINKVDDAYWAIVNRAFLVHLVITLTKVCEVYDAYSRIMPDGDRKDFKRVSKEIRARDVISLRNKFCAHIWDDELRTPLSMEELNRHIHVLCEGDLAALVPWFWNVEGKVDSPSIAGVIERCRNGIIQRYNLRPIEVCQV